MRLRRRSRPLLIRPLLAAGLLCLFSACATAESPRPPAGEEPPSSAAAAPEDAGCRPFFISPLRDEPEKVPNHSCWHRLWEVPAALVIAPAAVAVAVGVVTAPIWVPILLIP